MKKVRILMSVLMVSLFFVACESEKDEPTPELKFDPATVEVAVEAEAKVQISGGTAPYTIKTTTVEEGKEVVKATVAENVITIEGLKEGETTITATDKGGVKGEVAVKVTAKAGEEEKE